MNDRDLPAHDSDSTPDLPIQPTGHGVIDLEIAKLQAAVQGGAEDVAIGAPLSVAEPNEHRI